MTMVFQGQEIDFKSIHGWSKASNLYFAWLGSFFKNVKSITSNAIKMDWGGNDFPSNSTNN